MRQVGLANKMLEPFSYSLAMALEPGLFLHCPCRNTGKDLGCCLMVLQQLRAHSLLWRRYTCHKQHRPACLLVASTGLQGHRPWRRCPRPGRKGPSSR